MDWPLITAIAAGLAVLVSGWLVWATWRTLGSYGEVTVWVSAVDRRPASWLLSLAQFGALALLGGFAIAGQIGILQLAAPLSPVLILGFGALLAMQIAFLIKARRRRSRSRQAREDMFGE